MLEFDTKISEDDMGGNSNSTGEFDLGTAVEMLGLDDDDVKTQASRLQGAYMSFLLLRHLRLRDLQRSVRSAPYTFKGEHMHSATLSSLFTLQCLGLLNYFRSTERTLTINDGGLSLEGGKQKPSK